MNLIQSSFASLFVLSAALAADQAPVAAKAPAAAPSKSQWVFSLLPKSMQKNPDLDLTVITEVTEEGKKLPPTSPEHPAYYVAQPAGFVQVGDTYGNEKSLRPDEVEHLLKKALAANGYLPAAPAAQPPSLVVIYFWGSHNVFDSTDESRSADSVVRNILDRAALVGGDKFARELATLFRQADDLASANQTLSGAALGIDPVLGPAQMAFFDPVNLFKLRSTKNEFLVDQASDDCYYVVASAYDYAAIANKQRKLLWRTRMAVNSRGVSQGQSLPMLIASAAPYFGRDMAEPEILTRRANEEHIVIGTPTVVELPAGAPAKK
jgi:hypothetical protein